MTVLDLELRRASGTLAEVSPLPARLWPDGSGRGVRLSFWSGGRLTSGAVLFPRTAPPAGGWPLLAWGHCMVGVGGPNAPSLRGLPRLEREHLAAWLRRGFAVVAPDYRGLDTHGVNPFPHGGALAGDLLDIARAVRELDAPVGTPVIAAGFSQGAGVALAAAARWRAHAPDLDYRGTAALAPLDHLAFFTEVTRHGDAPVEQLVPMMLAGLRAHDPTFRPLEFLTSTGVRILERATTASMPQIRSALLRLRNTDLGTSGLTRRPDVRRLLRTAQAQVCRYDRPVLLCTTDRDVLAPPRSTARLAARLRRCGTDVGYRSFDGPDHLAVLPVAADHVARWGHALVTAPASVH
ncbi:lipase family protein [Longispora sp. NPDC051575]|uniref:lipase family protein n=1 Tax=Longispora sp. NPDC051575 TaxID=3154943 RepID=UPI00341F8EBE